MVLSKTIKIDSKDCQQSKYVIQIIKQIAKINAYNKMILSNTLNVCDEANTALYTVILKLHSSAWKINLQLFRKVSMSFPRFKWSHYLNKDRYHETLLSTMYEHKDMHANKCFNNEHLNINEFILMAHCGCKKRNYINNTNTRFWTCVVALKVSSNARNWSLTVLLSETLTLYF